MTGNRGSADRWWNPFAPCRPKTSQTDQPEADLNLDPTSSAPVDEVRRRLSSGEWEDGSDQPRRREPHNRSTVPAGRLGVLATNQRVYRT